MCFVALLTVAAVFISPILADDDDPAIAPADIPTACTVLCALVVQVANGCQEAAAAAAPVDNKKRWLNSIFLHKRDDDDAPAATTADPCICNNATVAVAKIAPPCDTCIQTNGATTAAVTDLIANCKLPAAAAANASAPAAPATDDDIVKGSFNSKPRRNRVIRPSKSGYGNIG